VPFRGPSESLRPSPVLCLASCRCFSRLLCHPLFSLVWLGVWPIWVAPLLPLQVLPGLWVVFPFPGYHLPALATARPLGALGSFFLNFAFFLVLLSRLVVCFSFLFPTPSPGRPSFLFAVRWLSRAALWNVATLLLFPLPWQPSLVLCAPRILSGFPFLFCLCPLLLFSGLLWGRSLCASCVWSLLRSRFPLPRHLRSAILWAPPLMVILRGRPSFFWYGPQLFFFSLWRLRVHRLSASSFGLTLWFLFGSCPWRSFFLPPVASTAFLPVLCPSPFPGSPQAFVPPPPFFFLLRPGAFSLSRPVMACQCLPWPRHVSAAFVQFLVPLLSFFPLIFPVPPSGLFPAPALLLPDFPPAFPVPPVFGPVGLSSFIRDCPTFRDPCLLYPFFFGFSLIAHSSVRPCFCSLLQVSPFGSHPAIPSTPSCRCHAQLSFARSPLLASLFSLHHPFSILHPLVLPARAVLVGGCPCRPRLRSCPVSVGCLGISFLSLLTGAPIPAPSVQPHWLISAWPIIVPSTLSGWSGPPGSFAFGPLALSALFPAAIGPRVQGRIPGPFPFLWRFPILGTRRPPLAFTWVDCGGPACFPCYSCPEPGLGSPLLPWAVPSSFAAGFYYVFPRAVH